MSNTMDISTKSRVILGEAPESDSEDDSIPANCSTNVSPKKKVQFKIPPEASEIRLPPIVIQSPQKDADATPEHFDLIRKNIAFRNKICNMTDKLMGQIRRELTATSDQLLASEMTLSDTSRSLNNLRQNAKELDAKLQTIVTSNFFPAKLNMLDYFRDIKITEQI